MPYLRINPMSPGHRSASEDVDSLNDYNITFEDQQDISKYITSGIPIQIYNTEPPFPDSTDTIVLEIDETAGFGFASETFTFSEKQVPIGTKYIDTTISLVDKGTIKTAIVIIEDRNGPAPIAGNDRNNSLYGNDRNNLIYAKNGNDLVSARKGNDTLYGGAGADTLYGGLGSDELYGGSGNDKQFGDDGNDLLFGLDGNDSLNGGKGNDLLIGGRGKDTLIGGEGSDLLTGGKDNDVLTGGSGKDGFIFYSPQEGVDKITDFNYQEDLVIIDESGFSDLNVLPVLSDFSFINDILYFKGTSIASLQTGSGFELSSHIKIVDLSTSFNASDYYNLIDNITDV
ncbi:calcium-binding protein [Gloeocapsopsis dulcis]|uniref:Calcium-binding protein n=1 Tax=Gloeocapsopsis dulcis AAB1 = 1H9 TaxID=1433147 RepID=A0A6N8G0J0_9CHRO|nr:calcium-binding protein [Gloeocapsopsis dulcis]MUL38412.1 hypothetical protein [Gloeocapsopsis dulcis AAB1 = 1H9]WNN89198.1 calcium-binding protein [Gloeocapsopsis dulcis]